MYSRIHLSTSFITLNGLTLINYQIAKVFKVPLPPQINYLDEFQCNGTSKS